MKSALREALAAYRRAPGEDTRRAVLAAADVERLELYNVDPAVPDDCALDPESVPEWLLRLVLGAAVIALAIAIGLLMAHLILS
jgi:hypothetical protein